MGDTPEKVSSRVVSGTVAIANEIKSFKPGVVLTNTSHIPWGALAASMTNTPHIWVVREYPINNFGYLAEKVNFIHQYSNKIMANSAELASFYREKYGFAAGQFMSYVDVSDIKLKGSGRVTHLVSPNYISATKNQIELIRAASIIKARRKDLKFRVLLMGEKDANYWPIFEKLLTKSGVADIIDIYDRVDEPWAKVTKNDVLVQTSLSESIGRTTTEAMKLGVPVIASDIPGHREAFSLGEGTLYELGNENDLADKIEYILDHPEEAKARAREAQSRALKNMSSDASSGPVLEAIEEVIGKPNPMGVNAAVAPYFEHYILGAVKREKELTDKVSEVDALTVAINDLRNSRAYRLGRVQANLIKRIFNITKLGRKK